PPRMLKPDQDTDRWAIIQGKPAGQGAGAIINPAPLPAALGRFGHPWRVPVTRDWRSPQRMPFLGQSTVGISMAKNTRPSARAAAVKERAQVKNPVTNRYVKIDTNTGRIVDQKQTLGPYKGIKDLTRKRYIDPISAPT